MNLGNPHIKALYISYIYENVHATKAAIRNLQLKKDKQWNSKTQMDKEKSNLQNSTHKAKDW
jgi:hypothetical protein